MRIGLQSVWSDWVASASVCVCQDFTILFSLCPRVFVSSLCCVYVSLYQSTGVTYTLSCMCARESVTLCLIPALATSVDFQILSTEKRNARSYDVCKCSHEYQPRSSVYAFTGKENLTHRIMTWIARNGSPFKEVH